MKKLRNITRIDNDVNHTHAWVVIVQRNNHCVRQYFSDGVYGGKRKALAAAKVFHTQVLEAVSAYEYHLQRRSIVRCNNSSGVSGVGRYDQLANPNTGRRTIYWLAYWDDVDGIRKSRKFSVLKYGERAAKKLAITERATRLHEVCVARYE
jgi:hypothetical protein